MRSLGSSALSSLVGGATLAVIAVAQPAEATSITFTYDCVVLSDTVCTSGGGPFGTITLTDNTLKDTNRVNIDVSINGAKALAANPNFTGLNDFFLNYSGSVPSGYKFVLVNQGDDAGTWANNAGDVLFGSDSKGPFDTFDLRLNPTGSCPDCTTFSGSLLLFLDSGPHTEANLDASMFNLLDEPGVLSSAFDTMPTNQSSAFGSSGLLSSLAIAEVPEPATLLLLGGGLIGVAHLASRRRARRM